MRKLYTFSSLECGRVRQAILAILILAVLVLLRVISAHAAVTLVYFIAESGDGVVVLRWETATEIDNAGFFVRRSDTQFGTYDRISAFIPGEGDTVVGALYEHIDINVLNGVTYWYKLETVDYNQQTELFGPISATPGETSAATSTVTSTSTVTGTPSATLLTGSTSTYTPTVTPGVSLTSTATSTKTPTKTSTPTLTSASAYPPPETTSPIPIIVDLTQTLVLPETIESGTPSTGGVMTSTATLIPLPTIVMVFPGIPSPTNSKVIVGSSPPKEESSDHGLARWTSPDRLVLIGMIALIWILLGGWFVFSMRRTD